MSSMSRAAFFGSALAMAGLIALCRNLSPQHDTTEDDKQGQTLNHQSKAEKTNNKRQDQDFQIIFRVFLRPVTPEDYQKSASDLKQETQEYVRTAFKVDSKVQIQVRSVVVDSFSNARIGILSFSKIPDSIEQNRTTRETISRSKDLPDMSLELNLNFDGLTPLFSGGVEQQSLDIFAVHGLGGHAIGSFKAENEDNMWLRDDLPRDMPNCRIFTFGYPSRVPDSNSFQSLYDLGFTLQNVLGNLVNHNQERGHRKRIVLIGHSLGGLIIKEAVDKLFRSKNYTVLGLIRGILFFGTPNQGMDNSKLLAMAEGGPNEDLLKSLSYDSETLRRQASDFENAIKSPQLKNLEIFSYYETELSRTYKKIDGKWKKEGELAKLVDRNSATNGRPGDDEKRYIQQIPRNHTNLVRYISNDHVYLNHIKPTLEHLLKTSQQPGLFYRTDEEDACLSSIRFHELDFRFDDIDEALDDTCIWLLDNPEYRKWSLRQKRLLLLTGHRTSGKSTLMKHAFRRLKSDTGLVVMSHFFWRSGTVDLQRNACGFFRSLMYQFLRHSSSSLAAAMPKYRGMSSEPFWHPKWMKWFLEKEIPQACKSQSLRIIIVVDAIDECDEEDRTDIMSFFKLLLSKSFGGDLRICVSYSPGDVSEEADIDMALHNYEDIARYVQNKLSALPKSKRSIPMDIQERAQGMFMWAKIACNKVFEMDMKGIPAKAILQAIKSLPKKLDDMFLKVLEDVTPGDAGETIKLFRWICFARRPLSIAELRYAIMIDPGMEETSIHEIHENPKFRKEQRDMIRAIFHLSRGLAKVVNRTSGEEAWPAGPIPFRSTLYETEFENPMQGHEKEVRLIHDCVHEFLLTHGLGRLSGSHSPDSDEEVTSSGHFQLSRSCLKYLAMAERHLWASFTDTAEVSTFLLLEYASSSWLFHTEHVERAKKPQHDVLQLLQWPSANILNDWIRIRNIIDPCLSRPTFGHWVSFPILGPSLLHILASHGLVSLLEDIFGSSDNEGNRANVTCPADDSFVEDGEQDKAVISCFETIKVNADVQDDAGKTPLLYAVAADQTAAAKLLLKIKHVNPNPGSALPFSPLHLAAYMGRGELMEAFFELPERSIHVRESLLEHAAINRWHGPEVIKILIDKGLPEVKITEGLVKAATSNHMSGYVSGLEVLRILIQDARLEMEASELILEPILREFDLETVQFFLQKRCLEITISEDILLAAAGNVWDGPRIMEFLLAREASATRITHEVAKRAAMNENGPMMMESFLKRGLEIEIMPEVLYLALEHWHHGEKVMRRLLQRTGLIIDWGRILEAATKATDMDSAQEMMIILLEERESELRSERASGYIDTDFLIRVLWDWANGEQVVNLLLQSGHFRISINHYTVMQAVQDPFGFTLIKFLLQLKGEEVRPLLSAEVWGRARQSWGDRTAERILSEDSSDSEDPCVIYFNHPHYIE